MRSEAEIKETNALLDRVENDRCPIVWFRSAYHSHENAIAHLKGELAELRELLDATTQGRELTVREAQLLNVCRVCRGKYVNGGRWLLNFGEEFAHEGCVKPNLPMAGIGRQIIGVSSHTRVV